MITWLQSPKKENHKHMVSTPKMVAFVLFDYLSFDNYCFTIRVPTHLRKL